MITLTGLGARLPVGTIICVFIGGMFVVLGNYMPQFRQNFFCGIRTPWALANGAVWRKTHRLGGILFVVLGFVLVAAGFKQGPVTFGLAAVLAIFTVVFLSVYSYIIYKKITKQEANHAEN
ncbi:SdpI family protein [Ruminococcaceae bacterium OttesenSCG-928-A16]|nr:SdpI family protein [Ruminococcaceae bacterium OttesenSCG-928-A16]